METIIRKKKFQFVAILEPISPLLSISSIGVGIVKSGVFRFGALVIRDLKLPVTETPKAVRVYALKFDASFAEFLDKVKIVSEETVVSFCRQYPNFLGTEKTTTFFRVSEDTVLRVRKLSDGLHVAPYNINDNIVWQARFQHRFVF